MKKKKKYKDQASDLHLSSSSAGSLAPFSLLLLPLSALLFPSQQVWATHSDVRLTLSAFCWKPQRQREGDEGMGEKNGKKEKKNRGSDPVPQLRGGKRKKGRQITREERKAPVTARGAALLAHARLSPPFPPTFPSAQHIFLRSVFPPLPPSPLCFSVLFVILASQPFKSTSPFPSPSAFSLPLTRQLSPTV